MDHMHNAQWLRDAPRPPTAPTHRRFDDEVLSRTKVQTNEIIRQNRVINATLISVHTLKTPHSSLTAATCQHSHRSGPAFSLSRVKGIACRERGTARSKNEIIVTSACTGQLFGDQDAGAASGQDRSCLIPTRTQGSQGECLRSACDNTTRRLQTWVACTGWGQGADATQTCDRAKGAHVTGQLTQSSHRAHTALTQRSHRAHTELIQ
eukprot:6114569-Prymnesium_polylepis.1